MADKRRRRSERSDYGNTRSAANERDTSVSGVDGDTTIDLVEMMYRLLANWKLIICLALACAILSGVFTVFFITPMYQATSTIYVLSRKDSALNMSDLQIGTALTQDYIKVFKLWEVHEQVISNLGLPYNYSQMKGMLIVTNDSNTRMLDITVKSPDPKEAAAIANEYAKVGSQYIADNMSTEKPNIMSVALVPANPVSPSKVKNVMLGFIIGGIVACAIVIVRMLTDDKIKTAEDIRKYTGLTTLALIPIEDGSGESKSGKGKSSKGKKGKGSKGKNGMLSKASDINGSNSKNSSSKSNDSKNSATDSHTSVGTKR